MGKALQTHKQIERTLDKAKHEVEKLLKTLTLDDIVLLFEEKKALGGTHGTIKQQADGLHIRLISYGQSCEQFDGDLDINHISYMLCIPLNKKGYLLTYSNQPKVNRPIKADIRLDIFKEFSRDETTKMFRKLKKKYELVEEDYHTQN